MSRESLDEFCDGELDYEDGTSEENGRESRCRSDSSAAEKPIIVPREQVVYDVSVSSLLDDYVVVKIADDGVDSKARFKTRSNSCYPPSPRDHTLDLTPRSEPDDDGDDRASEHEYIEPEDSDCEKGESGDSEDEELEEVGSNEDDDEIEDIRSVTATVNLERARLPQLDHSGSEIYVYEEAGYVIHEFAGEGAGGVNPPAASPSAQLSDEDVDEDYENGENENGENIAAEGYSTDDEEENIGVADERSYEGNMSASRASNSRLSALNSNLYKTDGENLSDVTLTRSFAYLHQKEIVEAGAKTIGELYVGLKRRKALEESNSDENADNRNSDSSSLINQRREENEKLKNKAKVIPKSTIPFEEKPTGKLQVKSALGDNDKPIAIPKKAPPSKPRANPSTVTMNSEIHVEPEVRGDMGSPSAQISVPPSVESLTPESLTLLCRAETGNQLPDTSKSVDSKFISDLDSRAGYISGRKNPQSKDTAVLREARKSRIPLPVDRKKETSAEQDRNCSSRITSRSRVSGAGVTAIAPVGSYWVAQKKKAAAASDTRQPKFKTRTVQLDNPAQLMTKGTACSGVDKKPPIPHQMRSVACYHNGKLDVAILGDRDLLAENDPLDVQITLVPQIKNDNPAANTHQSALPPLKKSQMTTEESKCSRKPGLPPLRNAPPLKNSNWKGSIINKKDDPKTNNKSKKVSQKSSDNRVKSSKQLPPLKRVNMKYVLSAKRNNGRNWSPSKNRMEQKRRREKVLKKGHQYNLPDVDWDVVHHRAQYPPFNTYTDPEASQRFQKVWCGY